MINKLINEYFNNIEYQTPIFTKDIYDYVNGITSIDNEMIFNTYVSRYVKSHSEVKRYKKGIFYKTKKTPFGEAPIDYRKLITKLYLSNDIDVYGYIGYSVLSQKLGLTTQLSKKNYYVTNNNRTILVDDNIELKKPVIKITKYNYKYLEALDIIENKNNIPYDCENPNEIIYNYLNMNNIEFEKLLHYALYYKSNSLLLKIAKLAR